jgi:hypothetical protein
MSYKKQKLKPFHTDFKVGDLIVPSTRESLKFPTRQCLAMFQPARPINLDPETTRWRLYWSIKNPYNALVVEASSVTHLIKNKQGKPRIDAIYTKRRLSSLVKEKILIPAIIMTGSAVLSITYSNENFWMYTHYEDGRQQVGTPALIWNTDGSAGTGIVMRSHYLSWDDDTPNNLFWGGNYDIIG